jgi:hypothetical protein
MQYLLLVYIDPPLLAAAAPGEFDTEMRQCIQHADSMAREGSLLGAQQLENPATAKTVRVRGGKTSVLDGPFGTRTRNLAMSSTRALADETWGAKDMMRPRRRPARRAGRWLARTVLGACRVFASNGLCRGCGQFFAVSRVQSTVDDVAQRVCFCVGESPLEIAQDHAQQEILLTGQGPHASDCL